MLLDYSRQRLDEQTRGLLFEIEARLSLRERFGRMCAGAMLNKTEQRAVLHTAARAFSDDPLQLDGQDVMPEIRRVRDQISAFSKRVHSGEITGSTGKPFQHVVVIGIGGSYLGTEFVSTALAAFADKKSRSIFWPMWISTTSVRWPRQSIRKPRSGWSSPKAIRQPKPLPMPTRPNTSCAPGASIRCATSLP
jgi:glucose-6-phosphate isomerase